MSSGQVLFRGIQQVVSADVTFSHGITPSVFTMTIAPQERFPMANGPLALVFQDRQVVTFQDCVLDSTSYERTGSGAIWRLAILDRRWKWAFGDISGFYNVPQADGKIDDKTQKKPRELAELCLKAMGEKDYDVSQLPNDTRPEIAWNATNPANALASICDPLGCHVVLGLDNKVRLCKLGQGNQLPGGAITDDAGTLDPPERPDSLQLIGAPVRYQAQLKLEAVGLETDGSIKKINELSYKPANGWGYIPISDDDWLRVEDGLKRKLASETVFRWYRVTGHRDGKLDIPGLKVPRQVEGINTRFDAIEQIFPLEDEMIEQALDQFDGRMKNKRARVVGEWCRIGLTGKNVSAPPELEYDGSFSIDRERGIVIFSNPVALRNMGTKQWEPAKLYLETAFGFRDADTRAFELFRREIKATGKPNGTKHRPYYDDGFVRTSRNTYSTGGQVTNTITNDEEINKRADEFLKQAGAEYQVLVPQERAYAGFVPINLDGAIQQVSWSLSQDGARTRASRNNEFVNYLPSYREKRQLEKQREAPNIYKMIGELFKIRGSDKKPVT